MTRSLAGTLVGTMAAAWAVLAPAATAQVGYPPSKSPYQDITTKQEFTFYGGQFGGSKGDAGVGPQSGGIFGVRYGIRLGGPADDVGQRRRQVRPLLAEDVQQHQRDRQQPQEAPPGGEEVWPGHEATPAGDACVLYRMAIPASAGARHRGKLA